MSRTLLIVVIFGAVAAAAWFGLPALTPAEVTVPKPGTASGGSTTPTVTAVGMSGCLASACHGAPAERTLAGDFDALSWMSSGSCWVACDPHRGTYDLLTSNPRRPVAVTAAEMMARLGSNKPATEDARCLACHTNPALAELGDSPDPRLLALRPEGVGCEMSRPHR